MKYNEVKTYSDMLRYCGAQREPDGFCLWNSGCSGPSPANYQGAIDRCPDGFEPYAGPNGCCEFFIRID